MKLVTLKLVPDVVGDYVCDVSGHHIDLCQPEMLNLFDIPECTPIELSIYDKPGKERYKMERQGGCLGVYIYRRDGTSEYVSLRWETRDWLDSIGLGEDNVPFYVGVRYEVTQ